MLKTMVFISVRKSTGGDKESLEENEMDTLSS